MEFDQEYDRKRGRDMSVEKLISRYGEDLYNAVAEAIENNSLNIFLTNILSKMSQETYLYTSDDLTPNKRVDLRKIIQKISDKNENSLIITNDKYRENCDYVVFDNEQHIILDVNSDGSVINNHFQKEYSATNSLSFFSILLEFCQELCDKQHSMTLFTIGAAR